MPLTLQAGPNGYRAEGEQGLLDRSSAPRSIPHRTPEERVRAIAALRRLRMTAAEIAECVRMPLSTVSAILTRIGLGKRSRLEPPEPPNRYERRHPGELLHIDVKKFGRIRAAGHRVTGSRAAAARRKVTINGRRTGAAAGSSCTSASTKRPGLPTSRCSPTRGRPPRPASCAARSRTTAPTASGSSA
ncbi:MAG TPA: leucine zipper domain-containing protein [Gaiellaceae bacterium]